MMDITNTFVTNMLLIANAAMLAAAVIAITRFRKQARRFEKFWDSPAGVSLADTQALEAQSKPPADPELEKRITELQRAVGSLAMNDRIERKDNERRLPIENAVRMAKHGASIEDLMRSCGLNIGEAQLMRKLHGQARAAAQGQ
jgi:hypothetical protein